MAKADIRRGSPDRIGPMPDHKPGRAIFTIGESGAPNKVDVPIDPSATPKIPPGGSPATNSDARAAQFCQRQFLKMALRKSAGIRLSQPCLLRTSSPLRASISSSANIMRDGYNDKSFHKCPKYDKRF